MYMHCVLGCCSPRGLAAVSLSLSATLVMRAVTLCVGGVTPLVSWFHSGAASYCCMVSCSSSCVYPPAYHCVSV